MNDDTLSTGECAKLLHQSLNTVIRQAAKGLLPFHRIPGSQHRRIRRPDLVKFMVDHHMPAEWIATARGDLVPSVQH